MVGALRLPGGPLCLPALGCVAQDGAYVKARVGIVGR